MSSISASVVLSHWCKLIEGLQMSSLEFYTAVEEAARRRAIPNIEVSRVDWNEGGVLSAKREYLRLSRGRHVFDVCGAPFGTGFFVSSWLARPEAAPWPFAVFLLFLAMSIVYALFTAIFGFLLGLPTFMVGFPFLFWVFAQVMNQEREGWDDSIVAIPFLGPVYQRIFRPETYYKIDTTLMFQQSVHNAVLEAVDQMTAAKGVRALSELERKPQLMAFGKAAGN